MNSISIITQIYESLSDDDKASFIEYLKRKPVKSSKSFDGFKSIVIRHKPAFLPGRPACAHCGSVHVIKNGHKDGFQRYLCKDCGKTFAITNNTLMYYSKKNRRDLGKVFQMPVGQVSSEEMRGSLRHRPFHGVHLEAQDTRRAPENAR
ncbi:MAG: hypothetical protein K6G15_06695, partial [Desulfovibrio sp.]|nr:hypothetical protein [Desulfovibrio sp.]